MLNNVTSNEGSRTGLAGLNSMFNDLVAGKGVNFRTVINERCDVPIIEKCNPNSTTRIPIEETSSTSNVLDEKPNNEILTLDHVPLESKFKTNLSQMTILKNRYKQNLNMFLKSLSKIFDMADDDEEEAFKLTTSQNLLRVNLLEITRRGGSQVGLNAVIGCEDDHIDSIRAKSDTQIIHRASGYLCTPSIKSISSNRGSSGSVSNKAPLLLAQLSKFELGDDEESFHTPTGSSTFSIDNVIEIMTPNVLVTNKSIVSVYANPNYGTYTCQRKKFSRNQSEQLLQEIKNVRKLLKPVKSDQTSFNELLLHDLNLFQTSQEITQILYSPVISDSVVTLSSDQSDPLLELLKNDTNSLPDPTFTTREYNLQFNSAEWSQEEGVMKMMVNNSLSKDRKGVITNIPCDSWMAMPLRMLPGDMVPFGLVIFLPLCTILLSLFTYFFLALTLN